MEIMIQNIKKIVLLTIIFFISCKKNDLPKTDIKISKENIKKDSLKIKSVYKIWHYSSNNLKENYKEYKIFTSKDSIKVYKSDKLICSGEIVSEKTTFIKYYKNKNTANAIKEQFEKEFGITSSETLEVIMNSYGDISNKGCQFPFNEMFVVNNDYLFFYDKGYYCFDENTIPSKVKKKITQLFTKPINKNDFLNPNTKFPIIDKKISIDSTDATSVYKLADNVYLTWFEGDAERWYITTFRNDKLFDERLIGKNETIETENGTTDNYIDFIIDKNLNIEIEYSTGKGFAKRRIFKTEKYFVNTESLKIESRN